MSFHGTSEGEQFRSGRHEKSLKPLISSAPHSRSRATGFRNEAPRAVSRQNNAFPKEGTRCACRKCLARSMLLCQTHAAPPRARRVPLGRRSQGRHRPLPRRDKRRSQTLRLDRKANPHPRRCQTREASVIRIRISARGPGLKLAHLELTCAGCTLKKPSRASDRRLRSR
jgi:5-methylcytosine-specific restriction endonuclease McrA